MGIELKTGVGVFAKYWLPGSVKTRLGKAIGMALAADLYQSLVATTVSRLSAVGDQRWVVFTPSSKQDEFDTLITQAAPTANWDLIAQAEGDLGDRLYQFTLDAFLSVGRVILLGTDSPDLPIAYVESAIGALAVHDVVLGPADDGGYYLLGMKRPHAELFASIPWSSSETLSATCRAATQAGLSLHLLPPWYDVDDIDTLNRLWVSLKNVPGEPSPESSSNLPTLVERCLQVRRSDETC